ncbi:MAG: hypothetical protein GY898_32850 [Proteobacteria bacterium]|nr:hypothetical protein [Pseudomonadota bacterium]
MRHRVPLLLLLIALSACTGVGELVPEESTPTSPEEVTITTLDSKTIAGTFHAAVGVERGRGVLLLHQVDAAVGEGHDRSDWDGVFEDLVANGISTLAIDFRSHGASDAADVPIFDLGSDREQLRHDVEAGLDYLDDRGFEIGADRIGVAGLGLGATMAVVAVHESPDGPGDWGADAVVVISGRHDRAVDLTPDGDPTLTLRDGLYVAAEDNALDAESASLFHAATTSGERRIQLVPGTDAHGAELLADDGVQAAIPAWFLEVLDP